MEELRRANTFYCGTIAQARQVPTILKSKKNMEDGSTMVRGTDQITFSLLTIYHLFSGDSKFLYENVYGVTLIAWVDNRMVLMAHTMPDVDDTEVNLIRRKKIAGHWISDSVSCPQAIRAYNRYMGAVDLADQLIAQNKKHFRQYRYVFVTFCGT